MRLLIVGLGSMGKRRIRNLQFLRAGTIIGFDPRPDRREEAAGKYGIKTFADFDTAMAEGPDALVISTPPDLHMPYMRAAAQAGKNFFCEASVVDEGLDELIRLCEKTACVAAPSSTMRFNPLVRRIKELIETGRIGRPLVLTYHSGQYLPDWHPWEDYRTFYVARRSTGACREIVPFELSWLTWIFGDVTNVSAFRDKLTDLAVDIDDVYQILLRFEGGVMAHLLVDVIARHAFRSFKLLGSEGVITWEWQEHRVRLFDARTKTRTDFDEPELPPEPGYIASEGMYIEEMRHFLASIEGKETYMYTLADDRRVLQTLYAAERSAERGQHVRLDDRAAVGAGEGGGAPSGSGAGR